MRVFLKKAGRQFCYQVNSTKINKFKTSALADIQHRLLTTNNDIKTATKKFITKYKKTEKLTKINTKENIRMLANWVDYHREKNNVTLLFCAEYTSKNNGLLFSPKTQPISFFCFIKHPIVIYQMTSYKSLINTC